MTGRTVAVAFALVALLGFGGMVLAAGNDDRVTAFSLDVPNAAAVVSLARRQEACEQHVSVPNAFAGIQAWVVPAVAPGAALDVTVRLSGTHRLLALGRLPSGYSSLNDRVIALSETVPADRQISICLRSAGPGRIALLGSGPGANSGTLIFDGTPAPVALALVFIRPHPRSFLSLLPKVFDRAALFRPSWVGAWTFWALSLALVGAFVLGAVAVVRAAAADGTDSGSNVGVGQGSHPTVRTAAQPENRQQE